MDPKKQDRTSTGSPGFTPQPVMTNRSLLRPQQQEMDVTFWELLASCPSPAWCLVPGMGPVPLCQPGVPASPSSPAGPGDPVQGQGINQSPRVTGQTDRVVPAPPHTPVMQGQSRLEKTKPSPRTAMGMEGAQVGWG